MSPNLRGALLLCVATAGYTINDTFMKVALQSLPLGQILFIRSLMTAALLVILFGRVFKPSQFRLLLHPAAIARISGEIATTFFFLMGLMHLPLAFATSIHQALPLIITIGAAFFFSEQVGWRRWCAVSVGFIGVLIIVRPGLEGFNVWSISALCAVLSAAMRDLVTRKVPKELHASTVSLTTTTALAIFGLVSVAIAPSGSWQPMETSDLGHMLGAAVAMMIGYQAIFSALRIGELSFMAPFRYTGLLWATLFGYLVFADVPDQLTILGSTLVIASGLYTLYRERKVSRSLPIVKSTSPEMAPDGL